jgi:ssDNA-binding Zn-finger/Zn-ribbon topoisomerase 1
LAYSGAKLQQKFTRKPAGFELPFPPFAEFQCPETLAGRKASKGHPHRVWCATSFVQGCGFIICGMARKKKSAQERRKERAERLNFDAFRKACPDFAGRPLKSFRRGGEPPDFLCFDPKRKRIGLELVEWLEQGQIAREKPLYSLEREYLRVIRSDKRVAPKNIGQVFVYVKKDKRLSAGHAKQFRKELYKFIANVNSRWSANPEWTDSQGQDFHDFSGFPTLAEHLAMLVFFSRDRFSPYPGVPWIWFEMHGGAFSCQWMLDALLANIKKKIEKYDKPGNKKELQEQRLDEFYLLAYYDQAVLYNTPYSGVEFGFADVASAVHRYLAATQHPFDKVFLFSPLERESQVIQVWPPVLGKNRPGYCASPSPGTASTRRRGSSGPKMKPDLREMDEVCCPDCGKPLIITKLADGRARFDGCGRNCCDVYQIPDGCISFGPQYGLQFIYKPKAVAATG